MNLCDVWSEVKIDPSGVASHVTSYATLSIQLARGALRGFAIYCTSHLATKQANISLFFKATSLPSPHQAPTMAEIKIDKDLFQERLSHFISAWKADKRSGDALFGGASSILILMGKTEESAQFQKNNAIHVWSSLKPYVRLPRLTSQ